MSKAIKIVFAITFWGSWGLLISGSLHSEEFEQSAHDTQELLQSGEVLNETIRADESGGAARFQILMDTDVEQIWGVIYSCDNAFVYLDGLRSCEVLEDDGLITLTRQVVKTSWLVPAQDFTFRTERKPFTRADFMRTTGSPKVMEGNWQFDQLPGGVLVSHEIRIKPFLPVPRFLIRHLMRNSMPEMLKCMRSMAGGSLNDVQQEIDAQSCPERKK